MKSIKEESPHLPIESILSFLRSGLQSLSLRSEEQIKIKDLGIINVDTLDCKFYSHSENSADLKVEISTIMGFLSSFFEGDFFQNAHFSYYAVRAYDTKDLELLSAVSSKEGAKAISKGNPIEWINSTIFQENTNDYRLSVAKKIISEIENTLRYVVKNIMTAQFGGNWWDQALNNKLGISVKETYSNQFGIEPSDGNILIDYTFTIQLKKIILTHWSIFKHLFNKKDDFENLLDELNEIRREEAHNRIITQLHLQRLNEIYFELMPKISQSYPKLLPVYLIDNWTRKFEVIMRDSYKSIFLLSKEQSLISESDPKLKLVKMMESNDRVIKSIKDSIDQLNSIVIPVQKKEVHHELIEIFTIYKNLQETKLADAKCMNLEGLRSTIQRIATHEELFKEFTKKFSISER